MSGPVNTMQHQQAQQQGLIGNILTLPFRLLGVLGASLLLSIVMECVGIHLFWPEQGWHHAQHMLEYELDQFSNTFVRSMVMQEPGHRAKQLIEHAYEVVFLKTGVLASMREASTFPRRGEVHHLLGAVQAALRDDLIAVAYVVLVFLVRLLILIQTFPLVLMAGFVGLVDGLVRRDLRRFGAGRESGFIYHRARAALMPLAVAPWIMYLALPVSIHPLLILLPGAFLFGLVMDLAAGSFKKYL